MKLLVAFLFAFIVVAQARSYDSTSQSDDGNVVVRVHFESNDDSSEPSAFPSFSSPRPLTLGSLFDTPQQPRPSLFGGLFNNDVHVESPSPFVRIFENMLRFATSKNEPEPEPEPEPQVISFHMEPFVSFADEDDKEDDDQNDDRFPDINTPLSRMFSRMSTLLHPFFHNTQFQSQESDVPKVSRRGGCTLLQMCGTDIERVCASAKRINIAQAIPRCLSRHRSELSERCGEYMDRRAAGLEPADDVVTEESAAVPSEEIVPSEPTEEIQPIIVPSEPVTPAEPTDPREACHVSATKLCPSADHSNMVELMACLRANQDLVLPLCLEHVKPTAAFHCALDAQTLCPGVSERRAVGRCLKEHASELSQECIDASRPPKTAPRLSELNVVPPATLKAQAPTGANYQVYAIAGVIGLAVLVVTGAIVIVRRRAAARKAPRTQVVSAVQLVNPNQDFVAVGASQPAHGGSYSTAFERELRPEEQL